jgi:hypothetical protein
VSQQICSYCRWLSECILVTCNLFLSYE